MAFIDTLFRPFETLVRPLDLPAARLPDLDPASPWSPVRLVWHFARQFKGVLLAVTALSVVSSLISLAIVWALAFIVDGVAGEGAGSFVSDNAALLAGLLVLFALVDPLVAFVRSAFMSQTVQTLLPAAMRWQGHRIVEEQDVAFFEDVFAGQVASRLAQVTSSVQRQMMVVMETIPRVAIQFIGSFTLLAVLAWPLAVPVAVWIAANILIARYAVPLYMERSAKVASATSRTTGALTDVYSNIAMVKLFAAETAEAGAIRSVIGRTVRTQHSENRAYILTNTAVQVLNVALIVTIFAIGLWGIADGFVSVGEFVAAATVSRTLSASSFAFIGLGQSVTRALGTIRDAMPILTTRPAITDAPEARDLDLGNAGIEFDGVTFAYDREPVLRDFTLQVAPGEKVGIVGLSGAGKSTLVSLLTRLRDVDAGAISVDGHDVRDLTQSSLRRAIGVVTQDVALLHRSIRDNIRYGDPDATESEIVEAARRAEAWPFVETLHDSKDRHGLDAFVGERGVKLSGGQRQRVAIARVLLKDAPILVLDEATSALDSEAEAAIQSSLDDLAEGKTVLAIAHRLSTLARMDRIVVMEAGTIAQEGNHADLLAQGGLYADLWTRQSGGFLAAKRAA